MTDGARVATEQGDEALRGGASRKPGWLAVRIEHIWLAFPLVLVLCFGFLLKLRLVDFWWHLKIGEIIVKTRSLPSTDLFSFTAAGRPFILQNWLVEVIYYLTYRAAGLSTVVALNSLLLVAALFPVYYLCRRATTHLRASVVAALIAAISLLYFGSLRTQVFSFALFSLFYWVLSEYRAKTRDILWVLPPLIALWVNFHGGFVLGLGLMAIFLGCEGLRRVVHGPEIDTLSWRELRNLALVLGLALIATLANPETYRLYEYVRAVATNPASQQLVLEWQPPRIDDLVGVVIFYGPFFLTLLTLLYTREKPELTDIVLFIVFSVLGIRSLRNGIWFSLIAAPILARYLPRVDWMGLIQNLRRYRRIDKIAVWAKHRKEAGAPIRYAVNRQIAAMLVTITVLVCPWVYPHLGNKLFGNTLWEASTPVGAMNFIHEAGLTGNIFHPQIYGDYLIWRLYPEQRTFVDGRVHVFPDTVIEDYRMSFRDPHWDERLAKYDIRFLLLSKTDDEGQMMLKSARESAGWRVLYEDDESVLFEKVGDNHRDG
jgi:hypothetical protein